MAGFGSLSGRGGGFGASFPSRSGAPNSQTVDYLRPQEEWQSDFDGRWQAEAGKARAAGMRSVAGRPDAPTGAANWSDSTGISSGFGTGGADPMQWMQDNRHLYNPDAMIPVMGQTMTTGADPNYHPDAPTPTWGPTFEMNGYQGQSGPGIRPTVVNDTWDAGYTPDFSALNAEKDQMTQRYDAFQRQNQAYNVMNGNGMLNGVLSDAYADPNYGQINTAGGTGVGQDPTSGVNMDWTGVYDPQSGSGSVGQSRRGWGR